MGIKSVTEDLRRRRRQRREMDPRATDVEVSIGIVSDDSVVEDGSTFVRTSLLGGEVASFGNMEDSEGGIVSVSHGSRPAE